MLELTEAYIQQRLHDTYQAGVVATGDREMEYFEGIRMRCAAVLLPLAWFEGEWHLVYTRRTETVEHHKGQVSFPGGGCELHETSAEETALREAQEEIGLLPDNVRLLGRLNDTLTVTGFRVTPVVGVVRWPFELRLEPAEVGRVFLMPLRWLADKQNWDEELFSPPGAKKPVKVIRYHLFDGEVLWGATARITHNFLFVLGLM